MDKLKHLWVFLLGSVSVAAVSGILIMNNINGTRTPKNTDFNPVALPNAAEDGRAEGASTTKNKVFLDYKTDVLLDLKDETVSLYFANPYGSTHSVRLEVLAASQDGDPVIIASSPLIEPGFMQEKLKAANADSFGNGDYEAYFRITFYDLATEAEEPLETTIPDVVLKAS